MKNALGNVFAFFGILCLGYCVLDFLKIVAYHASKDVALAGIALLIVGLITKVIPEEKE